MIGLSVWSGWLKKFLAVVFCFKYLGWCVRKVLIFCGYYLPGYKAGGPIRSVSNMVSRLGKEFQFYIATSDRDLGDLESYRGIRCGEWIRLGNAEVMYLERGELNLFGLVKIVRRLNPDVVYLNSFFDFNFSIRLLIARRLGFFSGLPFLLAPRGQFSPAALGLKSLRKSIFLNLARLFGLFKGVIWHASSQEEALHIVRALPSVASSQIRVALNLAADAMDFESSGKERGQRGGLRICFLGRISPMKNLDFALNILKRVNSRVMFSIYGPAESAEYWDYCRSLFDAMPENVTVDYRGVVPPHEVRSVLSGNDLFLFPTRGENYGHVIQEALSAGVPVLISDQTPWNSVEKEGVGWSLPLSAPEIFVEKVESLAALSDEARKLISNRARAYGIRVASDEYVLDQNRSLFNL